jgi:predicted AAA+ superfamily ATPase
VKIQSRLASGVTPGVTDSKNRLSSRNELTYYLPAGSDAVIGRDIDGERAETTALESRDPRFGQVGAARRIARTSPLSPMLLQQRR